MLTEEEKLALIKEAHALLDIIDYHANNIINILKEAVIRKVTE